MFQQLLRPIAIVAVLAGLAAYATLMWRGPQGVQALEERRAQIRALEEQNATLSRDIDAKRQRVERLKNDPSTQEVELERLGFVHKNDTEFKVTGQRVAPSTPASSAASGDSK
jgi:cell division protein FtsB